MMKHTCIVCGYDNLEYPQYENGYATQTICPCCGFQVGFHDDAMEDPYTIEEFREEWIKHGATWYSKYHPEPADFDGKKQLEKHRVKEG
ncbi:hypothetical protein [Brevibacillus dissolubilis]|uniref:hypothetical protein n=1 Tax=Brevibacillus dissolubilis TaxID=1844116 RepID=UPI0021001316|nr:hypothetical protein [Brevibacillus dissolubilis]